MKTINMNPLTNPAGENRHKWHVRQASGGPVQIADENGKRIATLADYNALEHSRLIAAAPCLLATLEGALWALTHYDPRNDYEGLQKQCFAAIKSAKGVQS